MMKIMKGVCFSSYGERSITEGLRTALARLRQRSTPPGSQTSPLHQPHPNVSKSISLVKT